MGPDAGFLQDLLFIYYAIYLPLKSCTYWLYKKLRRESVFKKPLDKVGFYRYQTMRRWLVTLVVPVAMGGFAPLYNSPWKESLRWNEPETWFLVVIVSSGFAWHLLEIVPLPWGARFRAALLKDLERLAHIVPETRHERRWWLWVCITAGVCEELVYRGFIFRYLQQRSSGPEPIGCLLFSSIVFSAIHFPYDFRGVLFSGIAGMMLGAIFLLSGNLLLPILVHVLGNGRILWIRSNTVREVPHSKNAET